MATVEKDIKEQSERISHVRGIVKERQEELELFPILVPTPISKGLSWKEKKFTHPERTIRLATMFSGIGAIEHAFQRLKLKHEIVFAGDIDEKCRQSYFANYEIKPENWFSDARCFDAKLPRASGLVGWWCSLSSVFHGWSSFGL